MSEMYIRMIEEQKEEIDKLKRAITIHEKTINKLMRSLEKYEHPSN